MTWRIGCGNESSHTAKMPEAMGERVIRSKDAEQCAPGLAAQAADWWHLVPEWPRSHSKPLEYTHEELGRLLDNLKEAVSPPDWPAKLAEALRESRANYRLMQQWLDQEGTKGHL